MVPRVYVCDQNPRMRQLLRERLHGHADIVGEGATADEAIAAAETEPDVVILDYRTAVGNIEGSVAAIKESSPATVVVIHTGVPRYLIEEQVTAAGGVYSPKNEPEHLIALVGTFAAAPRATASRGS